MKLLKGIWKGLTWLVGFRKQYHKEQKSYLKSSASTKIIIYFGLPLIFTAGAIALELFTFKLFQTHFGWAIVASVATVSIIAVTTKTAGIHSAIAFINAARTKVGDAVANMVESQENAYQVENGEFVLRKAISEDIVRAAQPVKNSKRRADFFVGIGCLILCVGLFITSIVLLYLQIKHALIAL